MNKALNPCFEATRNVPVLLRSIRLWHRITHVTLLRLRNLCLVQYIADDDGIGTCQACGIAQFLIPPHLANQKERFRDPPTDESTGSCYQKSFFISHVAPQGPHTRAYRIWWRCVAPVDKSIELDILQKPVAFPFANNVDEVGHHIVGDIKVLVCCCRDNAAYAQILFEEQYLIIINMPSIAPLSQVTINLQGKLESQLNFTSPVHLPCLNWIRATASLPP
jgi:hypothetical protein